LCYNCNENLTQNYIARYNIYSIGNVEDRLEERHLMEANQEEEEEVVGNLRYLWILFLE
jgi:hypothetical protein